MTALPEYELLEASGFYAESADVAPVEVLLAFGAASLTIMRFDETPLAHWPLATLTRLGDGPAIGGGLLLAPDRAAPERLRVSDPDMIAALRAVSNDFAPSPRVSPGAASRPRRKRIARVVAALAIGLGIAAAVWRTGPDAAALLARLTPDRAAAALGDAAVIAFAGDDLCAPDARGRAALARMSALADAAAPQAAPHAARAIDRDAPTAFVVAPGGRLVLFAPALARVEGPDALARGLAEALAQARAQPPLEAALRAIGVRGAASDAAALAAALMRGAPVEALRVTRAAAAAIGASPASAVALRESGQPDASLLRTLQDVCREPRS